MDVGVLTVLVVALAAMTTRAVVRLVLRRPTSRTLGVVALVGWLGLAVWATAVEARHQMAQVMAARMVRAVTHDARSGASCERGTAELVDLSAYAGHVDWDHPHLAQLRARTCADLAGWLASDKREPTLAQVVAVHVVVHEAEHVRGLTVESEAECAAMRDDVAVAVAFGAPPDVAERMLATYRTEVYPHLADEYHGTCR